MSLPAPLFLAGNPPPPSPCSIELCTWGVNFKLREKRRMIWRIVLSDGSFQLRVGAVFWRRKSPSRVDGGMTLRLAFERVIGLLSGLSRLCCALAVIPLWASNALFLRFLPPWRFHCHHCDRPCFSGRVPLGFLSQCPLLNVYRSHNPEVWVFRALASGAFTAQFCRGEPLPRPRNRRWDLIWRFTRCDADEGDSRPPRGISPFSLSAG